VSNAPTPPQPSRPVTSSSFGDTGAPPGDTANPAGPTPADPDLRSGSRPVPEYALVGKLGEGGFGQVWKARDDNGFEVALKFIRLDSLTGAIEMRALDVMKNIRHAHVLPLFRSWQVGDWLVVALELGDKTLHQRLAEALRDGQVGIPRSELLEYLLEAAKGLDYLHTLNIQHRDVKPANLLLVGGSVKVSDFGLAKLLEHSMASNSGAMTVAYAAPEQFQGRVSPNSDQYSLAVSYCQLRGGRLPFRGDKHEVMYGHIHEQPDLTMLPEAERPTVARALAKKPEQRWPSCRGFVEALAREGAAGTSGDVTPELGTTAPYQRHRVRRYAAGGALVLLATLAASIAGRLLPDAADRDTDRGKLGLAPGAQNVALAARDGPSPLDCTGPDGVSAAEVRRAQEEWAKYLGRNVEETIDIANGVTMILVLVPPGKFHMGSPVSEQNHEKNETIHLVTLTEPFDLGKFEVTQGQYAALTGMNPSSFKGVERPVEQVSWDEAGAFGRDLTKKLADKHVYRLPTEAEWEYSCRGGRSSSQPFGIGNGLSLSSREANLNGSQPYGGADKADYFKQTCNVGSYAANALGLYDMHGNVWEWCADPYGPYAGEEVINPPGPAEGTRRVHRGGCWVNGARYCRAASRYKREPGFRDDGLGFRLARSIPPVGR
jgi:formylglycine-generating enzyme required for sulfatase activity